MAYDLLRQLVETPGVPGREERVRELVAEKFSAFGGQISTDAMGSLIAHLLEGFGFVKQWRWK